MSADEQRVAARKDLVFEEAGTFYKSWVWIEDDGSVINLSNYTDGQLQIRDKDSKELLIDLNVTNGGVVLGGEDGLVAIRVHHTQLVDLTWEHAEYDFRVIGPLTATYPDGKATFLLHGDVHIAHTGIR